MGGFTFATRVDMVLLGRQRVESRKKDLTTGWGGTDGIWHLAAGVDYMKALTTDTGSGSSSIKCQWTAGEEPSRPPPNVVAVIIQYLVNIALDPVIDAGLLTLMLLAGGLLKKCKGDKERVQ